jgi:hypothetical protein
MPSSELGDRQAGHTAACRERHNDGDTEALVGAVSDGLLLRLRPVPCCYENGHRLICEMSTLEGDQHGVRTGESAPERPCRENPAAESPDPLRAMSREPRPAPRRHPAEES